MPRVAKDHDKPKGRMSAYAYFMQTCREEQKKSNPGGSVNFTEFTKKCADRWKNMTDKEKQRFHDMATRDKARYDSEMRDYHPAGGKSKGGKAKKDPNAPKRALSAFFHFSNEERAKVRAQNPDASVGDVAKELGKRWAVMSDAQKGKFQKLAEKDKQRYDKEMSNYKKGGSKPAAKGKAKHVEEDEDDEEDEDEDDDDEEEDDDE